VFEDTKEVIRICISKTCYTIQMKTMNSKRFLYHNTLNIFTTSCLLSSIKNLISGLVQPHGLSNG